MIAQTLAVATLAASAAAGWTSKTGSCNTGQISCCDTNKKAQKSTGEESGLLHTGDVLDQVAIQCDQIPVLAIAIEDECKNTPTCCEDVEEDGLVGINCTPIALI